MGRDVGPGVPRSQWRSPGHGPVWEGKPPLRAQAKGFHRAENWERVMCKGLAQHCWQNEPKQYYCLALLAEQTRAAWNSHLGPPQLRQAWPKLSIDLLGAEVALLVQAWLWKAGLSSLPQALGPSRAVPIWPAHLHPASLEVWGLQWDAGYGACLLVCPGPPPAPVGKIWNPRLEVFGRWLEIHIFFNCLLIPLAESSPYIMEVQAVAENTRSPVYSSSS